MALKARLNPTFLSHSLVAQYTLIFPTFSLSNMLIMRFLPTSFNCIHLPLTMIGRLKSKKKQTWHHYLGGD